MLTLAQRQGRVRLEPAVDGEHRSEQSCHALDGRNRLVAEGLDDVGRQSDADDGTEDRKDGGGRRNQRAPQCF